MSAQACADLRDKLTAMLHRMPELQGDKLRLIAVMIRRCTDEMLGRVTVHVMREVLRQSRFLLRQTRRQMAQAQAETSLSA